MGRAPCCDKNKVRKGAWTPEEDHVLVQYIMKYGHGTWRALPKHAGLQRCGKSCRLRWINYLRPDIKRGPFTAEEEATIIRFHQMLGNRWSTIASQLPGRTDNEIKNFWNTHLKKRVTHVSLDKQYQKDPTPAKDAVQSETSSSSHPEINNEDNRAEADSSIKSSSPSNSCLMDDNNDFLKWLFDIEEDEPIGNLSGRDMEQLDLVLQDMDMVDGSTISQNGLLDNKKDTEETFTKSTAPYNSSKMDEDSSGSHVEDNHDSNPKSDSLDHQANDNQTSEQEGSNEVVENMFPESTSSLPCDLEDYLGSDFGFLLDFPLEDIDI